MSETTLQYLLGGVFFLLALIPLAIVIKHAARQARARAFVLVDRDGKVIGEISADSIQKAEPENIARLRERVRQKHDVSIRAA
ncbi:hypothetical protein EAS61_29150 [Bradyrhizobium zhanjiangense]|uniref:CBS domain-containing protein n=1 Tax=Bradyrhizobium zhanjiangense TaxID=1325107 RepID=A0A4Q0QDP3_9BRAD|nr:hypothetical protein EAS61_29150 [Bradyrhizobium zhanjiangense]